MDYSQAGVNRDQADALVGRIGILSKKTLNKKVKSKIGGYASLYEFGSKHYLAATTDGVGTKLKLAMKLGVHHTVGIDLVAMSVNDLICVGAEPMFFLDYFATGKLEPVIADAILAGIVEGCAQAGTPLVGGETAEMPDFYPGGDYDLAGFAVGSVEKKKCLPRTDVKPGDLLIGVASSGFHSNGYSLLRKWWAQEGENPELGHQLLTPTRIYVKSVVPLLEKNLLKGLAHITGSGFLNVPRISDKVSYEIHLPPLSETPSVYQWVRERGLPFAEAVQTFNMGVGLVLVIAAKNEKSVLQILRKKGEKAWVLGQVVKKKIQCTVQVDGVASENATLIY